MQQTLSEDGIIFLVLLPELNRQELLKAWFRIRVWSNLDLESEEEKILRNKYKSWIDFFSRGGSQIIFRVNSGVKCLKLKLHLFVKKVRIKENWKTNFPFMYDIFAWYQNKYPVGYPVSIWMKISRYPVSGRIESNNQMIPTYYIRPLCSVNPPPTSSSNFWPTGSLIIA